MTIMKHRGPVWMGWDVHKDSISAGIMGARDATPTIELIGPDEDAVRRLVARVGRREQLRVCYEAGPTGYELYRLLTGMGVHCEVIAPSLIPKAGGDKVKTDRRDAGRLTRLFRAGELVAIRVPSPTEEAVRDLCRARADVVDDLRRSRQRLGKFLLRHGKVYRGGRSAWTLAHHDWLNSLVFDERALTETFRHYRMILEERERALAAVEADLRPWCAREPFAGQVARLACYRGVGELAGLTFAAEVCDWRRFATAPNFMGFTGLVPSEYSSGGSQRRGQITHAGNAQLRTQLVESAWSYRYPARIGAELSRRQSGAPRETVARSWAAQRRLCARFRRLSERKHIRTVVVTAVARELAGFLWAEMTAA